MAYNYYQPMGYTPFYNQSQQFQQIQPQIQPQSTMNTGIVWVADYNEAAIYPVAPNAAVILRDKADPRMLYLRWADATGKPDMTIYEERKKIPQQEQPAESRYATVEALENLSRTVDGIIAQLNKKNGVKTSAAALKTEGVIDNG